MTDRQDDSGALRERLQKWSDHFDGPYELECLLDEAIRALSPQGSEPAGVGEPVAYRWRERGQSSRPWVYMPADAINPDYAHEIYEIEWLYAAPAPAQQAVTDAVVAEVAEAAAAYKRIENEYFDAGPRRSGSLAAILERGDRARARLMAAVVKLTGDHPRQPPTAQGASDA